MTSKSTHHCFTTTAGVPDIENPGKTFWLSFLSLYLSPEQALDLIRSFAIQLQNKEEKIHCFATGELTAIEDSAPFGNLANKPIYNWKIARERVLQIYPNALVRQRSFTWIEDGFCRRISKMIDNMSDISLESAIQEVWISADRAITMECWGLFSDTDVHIVIDETNAPNVA